MSNKNNGKDKKKIGNYQFIKTIGEGTFGKVKLSIHLPTKEYVAIKILEKSRIHDKEELERVEKEIKYLKNFNHINIIQIYEVIETDQSFYIVMEYVAGGELFNYIVDQEKLSENEASFFFVQLIYGIKEIHKKKICHRDIKPENLLLTENKIIKIIDFGLSNEYTDYLTTQCGSPCYASPEMIRGMKYNGLMIDLWACGIILFAMLCGYLPFDDKDNNILFRKILQCKLEFPNENETLLSNEAKDLIKRILTPNPLKRIKIDEVLCHPFLNSGLKEYKNIVKPNLFNHEKIIVDYMVNKLNYSNENQIIYKYIKSNKHNSCTTTYKLLKKKFLEGSFDYDYNIENIHNNYNNDNEILPFNNIKIKMSFKNKENTDNHNQNNIISNNINNKYNIIINNNKFSVNKNHQNVRASLRKSSRQKNNEKLNMNKSHSFKTNKKYTTTEINIPKNKENIEQNALFTLKNNIILKNSLKMDPLYQKLLTNKKNKNNFRKKIDTSVSVVKNGIKKRKKIKMKSTTPPKYERYAINPFSNESNNYKNLVHNKIIYIRKYLLNTKKGLSADKIKPKKSKDIKTGLNDKYFGGLKNLEIKLEKMRNGYALTPIQNIKYITKFGTSADKIPNKLMKLKKNNNIKKKNINNRIINKKRNKKIISELSTHSSLFPNDNNHNIKKIKAKSNDRKNIRIENKTVENPKTPLKRKNLIIYNYNNIKTNQYKKILYNNIYNHKNYNTIETHIQKNLFFKNNNNNNNNNNNIIQNQTLNTNILYNNNKTKPIKSNKIKLKIRDKIFNTNAKYVPLTQRDKNPSNEVDLSLCHKKLKTSHNLNNNFHCVETNNILLNKDIYKNNILIVKKPEIKNFLITNINLGNKEINNKLVEFCKNNKYKYCNCNKTKYIIYIDNKNSFVLEINMELGNKIINLYHNTGSNDVTKENMNRLWYEINKNSINE